MQGKIIITSFIIVTYIILLSMNIFSLKDSLSSLKDIRNSKFSLKLKAIFLVVGLADITLFYIGGSRILVKNSIYYMANIYMTSCKVILILFSALIINMLINHFIRNNESNKKVLISAFLYLIGILAAIIYMFLYGGIRGNV